MSFGPFATDIEPAERVARLRALRAIGLTFARPHGQFLKALEIAETDETALPAAHHLFEKLPALPKRKILCTYANLGRPIKC